MRERADILQGKLEWLRPPQGGTLVILEMPLTQAATV
jgi:nitrate/nitrite-specific signal transduction histidine kinase